MTVAEKLQPLVDVAYNAIARYGRPRQQSTYSATYENIPAYQAHVAAELANGGGDPYSAPETSPKNAMRVSMVYSLRPRDLLGRQPDSPARLRQAGKRRQGAFRAASRRASQPIPFAYLDRPFLLGIPGNLHAP